MSAAAFNCCVAVTGTLWINCHLEMRFTEECCRKFTEKHFTRAEAVSLEQFVVPVGAH